MQFQLAVLAIPVFFALIGLEQFLTCCRMGRRLTLEEAVSNLGCGILQQFVQMPLRLASFTAYVWVYSHLRLATLPSTPRVWFLCLLAADFLAYWYHRFSHRVAMFWASHEVHHQSEGLDLTVSLRVPALDYYYWLFDLPLAALGFPPAMFLLSSSVVSIYGFSSHTALVPRLGPLEWLFVTPSHHRLHHARNDAYLDRNYGKVLILWDRIFGTFVMESESPAYGTPTPLESANPIWANVRPFVDLIRKAARAPRIADRIRTLIMPPSWKPGDAQSAQAALKTSAPVGAPSGHVREVPRLYVLVQFLPTLLATIAVLNVRSQLSTASLILVAALLIGSTATLGGLLDGRPWARRAELVRLGSLWGCALVASLSAQ